VLVTHDQDEALSVADYVAVLRDGVITQEGPPRDVYSAPADPWTAGFLGTANILPGTIAAPDGVRTVLGRHELRHAGHLPDGAQEVSVLIRPEQIALHAVVRHPVAQHPGHAAGDPLTGKVMETRYHGHDALIVVDVAEAGALQVRALGGEQAAPGDEVAIEVSGPVTAWPAQGSV